MPSFRPGLSAREVDARLRESVRVQRAEERNIVLFFTDVLNRRLYRELGYGSIYAYAGEALGFSKPRTAQLLRLCGALETLPGLRRAVSDGELPWTKAREVARVATAETEGKWIQEARAVSRRKLEGRIARARSRDRSRRDHPGQGELPAPAVLNPGPPGAAGTGTGGDRAPGVNPPVLEREPVETPQTVSFRLSPAEYARYEALLERLRKAGARGARNRLLLEALDALAQAQAQTQAQAQAQAQAPAQAQMQARAQAAGGGPRGTPDRAKAFPRGNDRPTQVVIHACEECGSASVATGRGELAVSRAILAAALCDGRIHRPGERNRAAVPEPVRRQVLARDRHRCRAPGCGSARFLEVHHRRPRERGGSNDPDNLITLCSGCHAALHRLAESKAAQVLGFFPEQPEISPGKFPPPAPPRRAAGRSWPFGSESRFS